MAKSSQAFRTIREVADWLDVKAHVLRFWESKFPQIKPVKRAGGRRYYRPGDMELVGGIKVLLHEQGMTIKGVQDLIRDEGIGHVSALSPPVDTLDFDDAPSDEIAAWDRELADDSVEEAEVIAEAPPSAGIATLNPEPLAELPAADPVAEEASAPIEPPLVEVPEGPAPAEPEEPAETHALDPVSAPDDSEAGFDLERELAELEATLASAPAEQPSEPEFSFEPPESAPAAASMPPAEPVRPAADPEPASQPEGLPPQMAAPAEPEVPAPVESAVLAAEEPQATLPDPMAPTDAPMIALMADFADLTARIPALPEAQRAALAPLLARSADLAARLSA